MLNLAWKDEKTKVENSWPKLKWKCWNWRNAAKRILHVQGLKALYPPGGGPDSIQVLAGDLARLDPDEFLNDTIIDFFTK